MTDSFNRPSPYAPDAPHAPTDPAPVTCDEVTAWLPAYAAGTLTNEVAWRVEWHAAHCAACEQRLLELPSVVDREAVLAALAPQPQEQAAWRAAWRATLRSNVQAMETRRSGSRRSASRRTVVRWLAPVGLAAAAVFMFVAYRGASVVVDPDTTDSTASVALAPSAPVETAMQLASAQAAPEFAALDAATREIDAALASAPNDRELRAFRSTLDARRDELTQRVRSVSE